MTKPLPKDKQQAFVESSLYDRFSIEEQDESEVVKFLYGAGTLDSWCTNCQRDSVFHIKSQLPSYGEPEKKLPYSGIISIEAECGRGGLSYDGCRSTLNIIFKKDFNEIIKIGQYPSVADLEFKSLKKGVYNELSKDQRVEFGKAVGLVSHGIGIGSFVYLRRIFEDLVNEAHEIAIKKDGWDEDVYNQSRMSEKIKLLSNILPTRLVENSSLYGILSLGIHELSEKECIESFSLVKGAIELILTQRYEEKQYTKIISQVQNKTANLKNK